VSCTAAKETCEINQTLRYAQVVLCVAVVKVTHSVMHQVNFGEET